MPDVVYHAAGQQGLRRVLPHTSLHRHPWVYATTDIHLAALFVSKEGSDLSCATGLANGELYVYERWDGAFDHRYQGRQGSIYELPGETFQRGRTSFHGEVVSEVSIPPRSARGHRPRTRFSRARRRAGRAPGRCLR